MLASRTLRAVLALQLVMTSLLHGVRSDFVLGENGVLVAASSEYHAYDDAWTVNFENVDSVDFDVLVFEVCAQQPCPAKVERVSALLDCAGLVEHFNNSAWHNAFVASQISAVRLCEDIHENDDATQIGANAILRDADEAPWMIVRQPLALEFGNDESMLQRWTHHVNASDVGMNTSRLVRELVLRVTQVMKLQRVFAVHQSLVRVSFAAPTQAAIVFGVQNPCTARGFTAPEFGGVSQRFLDGRDRCLWTCRVDLFKRPYNSVPPVKDQLNASHPAFAALDPKYECAHIFSQWVAVFFGFEIDTRMLATEHEYTQVLYDALDRMALLVERELARDGRRVLVALAVHDSLYHAKSFREQLRDKAETSCMLVQCPSAWYPSAAGWTNEHFLYARRSLETWTQLASALFSGGQRRRTMSLHTLRIDGVVLTDDINTLYDSTYRLRSISNIREAVRTQGDSLQSFSPTLQISKVEDLDISNVVGFVDPRPNRKPEEQEAETGLKHTSYSSSNYVVVVVAISLIITSVLLIVCVLFCREVYGARRRRNEEWASDSP